MGAQIILLSAERATSPNELSLAPYRPATHTSYDDFDHALAVGVHEADMVSAVRR